MKNIILSTLFVSMIFNTVSATMIERDTCRIATTEVTANDTERVKMYLMNGIWIEKTPSCERTYQFFTTGMVHIATTLPDGNTRFDYFNWQLSEESGSIHITFTKGIANVMRILEITPNKSGFLADDIINHHAVQFMYSPYKDDTTLGSNIRFE